MVLESKRGSERKAAEQEAALRMQVALKAIKPGINNREVLAGFDAVRQALLSRDHPGIARISGAGTTDWRDASPIGNTTLPLISKSNHMSINVEADALCWPCLEAECSGGGRIVVDY